MTQKEAIKRTSVFLRSLFQNDIDVCASVNVAEAENDVDFFLIALEQMTMSLDELKKGLLNK